MEGTPIGAWPTWAEKGGLRLSKPEARAKVAALRADTESSAEDWGDHN